jgi:GTPase SAR1 family protein
MTRPEVAGAFRWVRELRPGHPVVDPGTARVLERVAGLEDELARPLRLAVVGRVSAGKSTLVNTFVGQDVAPTGARELTYTVSVIRRTNTDDVVVHFRDGRRPESRPLRELRTLSVRDPRHRELLTSIDHLEIELRDAGLGNYELVDTPGYDSVHDEDSANVLRLLRRTDDDVRRDTVRHAADADGLLMVVNHTTTHDEHQLIADFAGAENAEGAHPVAAVGALTKIESDWPDHNPLEQGRRMAAHLMASAGGRRILFDLVPVAGLVAGGATTLTEGEYVDLATLAEGDVARLEQRLAWASAFAQADNLPVPADRRRALLARLGRYGVHLALRCLTDGVTDPAGLRAELLRRSGFETLRRRVDDHFGTRGDLVMLKSVIERVTRLTRNASPELPVADQELLRAVRHRFLSLEPDEPGFIDLEVLRRHRAGELHLDDAQVADLLRVAGERGLSVPERLGLPATTGDAECLATARAGWERWASVSSGPPRDGPTRYVAGALLRRHEHLIADLTTTGTSRGN